MNPVQKQCNMLLPSQTLLISDTLTTPLFWQFQHARTARMFAPRLMPSSDRQRRCGRGATAAAHRLIWILGPVAIEAS